MKDISDVLDDNSSDWDDWHWQMRQKPACSDLGNLASLGLVSPEAKQQRRRVGLTPYNVKLLLNLKVTDPKGYRAETLQSFLSPTDKNEKHQWFWAKRHDLISSWLWARLPIPAFLKTLFTGRGSDTSIRALENMYPNTDVVIATAVCARHCSFCFREVGDAQGEAARMTGGMEIVMNAVNAIITRKTPHVLVTGGDPLTRNNQQLRQILTPLVQSETVQVLRLATRLVVDLPMRFYDEELLAMLRDFAQQMKRRHASFRIVTHVNHSCELTPEAVRALENIQACGIEVMDQTAVLHGINDDVATLRELLMKLDRLGVRNYKLYHSMPVEGTEQLRVPYRKFRQLVGELHQWLPGTSVPQANLVTLVGKMPVSPKGRWILPVPFTNRLLCRSFRGEWYLFKDAWDIGRHLREATTALITVVLLLVAIPLLKQSEIPITHRTEQLQTVMRVAVLADKLGYPDAWARQRFIPFVENNTLYIPVHGL
ncbi:MAG: hypothetical protein A3H57_00455 [Candidatus Taylorbacteria bacterium RIFCSPLOWO2_02_FULL_43_11]|uniref:Radical SAM core domain-containing protein n=1 Tax=Candidatus Taylorbacteria bacterium RIFCSPHIGHO2_02_FULL_43_32b TaxID=1802306 RepID=A0A1G2MEH1_9BACT|nr:MAG: hypothetical protein A3C72_04335 [Candidatus Taylorbacteria bacterium RIFCSPHIGHO2_02_FULL_43_32b]OHA36463.1 MAG: hypothetical protein A3H57_00455 [Candidatus Taylorbacteria bacterium RIFCSPLOWO2_02_FULL_43_11]